MHDIRVLQSGDNVMTMSLCMTLSGHTSTLPRLVVQGHVFEGSWLQSGFGQKSTYFFTFMTEGVICTSWRNSIPCTKCRPQGVVRGRRGQKRSHTRFWGGLRILSNRPFLAGKMSPKVEQTFIKYVCVCPKTIKSTVIAIYTYNFEIFLWAYPPYPRFSTITSTYQGIRPAVLDQRF